MERITGSSFASYRAFGRGDPGNTHCGGVSSEGDRTGRLPPFFFLEPAGILIMKMSTIARLVFKILAAIGPSIVYLSISVESGEYPFYDVTKGAGESGDGYCIFARIGARSGLVLLLVDAVAGWVSALSSLVRTWVVRRKTLEIFDKYDLERLNNPSLFFPATHDDEFYNATASVVQAHEMIALLAIIVQGVVKLTLLCSIFLAWSVVALVLTSPFLCVGCCLTRIIKEDTPARLQVESQLLRWLEFIDLYYTTTILVTAALYEQSSFALILLEIFPSMSFAVGAWAEIAG